jgi:hypothetical protein
MTRTTETLPADSGYIHHTITEYIPLPKGIYVVVKGKTSHKALVR